MNSRCVELELTFKKVAEGEQEEVWRVAILSVKTRLQWITRNSQMKRIYATNDEKENNEDVLNNEMK